jgi:hypothetical protein
MSVTKPRLSNRQIATLKHIAICCADGGMTTLTRNEREAMQPLWRRGIVEIWFRCVPDEGTTNTPFFKPSRSGWRFIRAILDDGASREAISESEAA